MKKFTLLTVLSIFLVLTGCKKFNEDFVGNWTYKEKGFSNSLALKKEGDEIIIYNNFGDRFRGTVIDNKSIEYSTGNHKVSLVLQDKNTILSNPSGRVFKRNN